MAATTVTISPAYPGRALRAGSSSSEVARIQKYLNALAATHPEIHSVQVDGRFGEATKHAVEQFQRHAGVAVDGVVGRDTWNALILDYNDAFHGNADTNPGITLRPGADSDDVGQMQRHLNTLGSIYTAINEENVDNRYGERTKEAVRRYQRQFALEPDGIIGPATWASIVRTTNAVKEGGRPDVYTPYPGTPLREGSSGDSVRFLQSYLNRVHGTPLLEVDGRFGEATKQAVKGFQMVNALTEDGVVGRSTWEQLLPLYNAANH